MFEVKVKAMEPRGFTLTYRENEVNVCPGCSKSHWHIGRSSVECHFCGTVLPLPQTNLHPFNATTKPVLVHNSRSDAARGRYTINSRA